MQPTERFLPINGLQVRILDWDSGAKESILYFPVYTGHAHETDAFAALIADRFRFIAVDARGHGKSEWGPPDSYTPDQYYADAVAVRDLLGLDRPVLMGSSFGGATALRMAATEPDRARALIMDDQPPEMPAARTAGPLLKTYERQKDERFASIDAVVEWAYRYRGPTWAWDVLNEPAVRHWAEAATKPLPDGRLGWRHDPEIFRCLAPFAGRPEADLRPMFASVTVPTLVARRTTKGAGLLSPLWEELQALNPRARFLTFENAGHPVVLTQPEALAAATLAFLEE